MIEKEEEIRACVVAAVSKESTGSSRAATALVPATFETREAPETSSKSSDQTRGFLDDPILGARASMDSLHEKDKSKPKARDAYPHSFLDPILGARESVESGSSVGDDSDSIHEVTSDFKYMDTGSPLGTHMDFEAVTPAQGNLSMQNAADYSEPEHPPRSPRGAESAEAKKFTFDGISPVSTVSTVAVLEDGDRPNEIDDVVNHLSGSAEYVEERQSDSGEDDNTAGSPTAVEAVVAATSAFVQSVVYEAGKMVHSPSQADSSKMALSPTQLDTTTIPLDPPNEKISRSQTHSSLAQASDQEHAESYNVSFNEEQRDDDAGGVDTTQNFDSHEGVLSNGMDVPASDVLVAAQEEREDADATLAFPPEKDMSTPGPEDDDILACDSIRNAMVQLGDSPSIGRSGWYCCAIENPFDAEDQIELKVDNLGLSKWLKWMANDVNALPQESDTEPKDRIAVEGEVKPPLIISCATGDGQDRLEEAATSQETANVTSLIVVEQASRDGHLLTVPEEAALEERINAILVKELTYGGMAPSCIEDEVALSNELSKEEVPHITSLSITPASSQQLQEETQATSPISLHKSPVSSPMSQHKTPVSSPMSQHKTPVHSPRSQVEAHVASPSSPLQTPVASPRSQRECTMMSPKSPLADPLLSPRSPRVTPMHSPRSLEGNPPVYSPPLSPLTSPKSQYLTPVCSPKVQQEQQQPSSSSFLASSSFNFLAPTSPASVAASASDAPQPSMSAFSFEVDLAPSDEMENKSGTLPVNQLKSVLATLRGKLGSFSPTASTCSKPFLDVPSISNDDSALLER